MVIMVRLRGNNGTLHPNYGLKSIQTIVGM